MKDYGEDGLAIYEDGTRETQEEHNRLLEEAEAARKGKDGEVIGRLVLLVLMVLAVLVVVVVVVEVVVVVLTRTVR